MEKKILELQDQLHLDDQVDIDIYWDVLQVCLEKTGDKELGLALFKTIKICQAIGSTQHVEDVEKEEEYKERVAHRLEEIDDSIIQGVKQLHQIMEKL